MSNGKEERDVYYIPGNFLTSGRLFGGMIRVRNAIEACALVLLTGLPIINLGISLTARVIILCLITLPLGVFGVVGIEGDSLSEFVINWFRWLCNRRVLYRSDTPAKQEPEKPSGCPAEHRLSIALLSSSVLLSNSIPHGLRQGGIAAMLRPKR